MDLLMFIFVAGVAVISDGFTVHGPSGLVVASLGSSVVLPCYVDEPLPVKDLEVEWRRTNSETLVHLYQDGESRAEVQQQDYHDRAHFFTDQIQHGNFSLRLDNLRAEDKGQYTCKVYSQQDSGETEIQIKVDNVERLLVSGSSRSISASVGEDVTLNCSVDSHIKPEDIEEVSWKKTDEGVEILVLHYENNEAFPDSSNERYRDRVEFFTDEIPKGNFSLRLKSVRTEDKGVYMCEAFAGRLSANATVVLERLGFSALQIMVLILSIAASGSALLLCCLIFCISHDGFTVRYSQDTLVPLGSSVVLRCYSVKPLPVEDLKVEWRRKDTKALVHLYQDSESRAEEQHKDYHDRAHFFTDQIQHGNFSLRLDNLRAEDKGAYTCKVYSKQRSVLSTQFTMKKDKYSIYLEVEVSSAPLVVPPGSSVVLPCYSVKPLPVKDLKGLKVEWRRTDSETLVHLYRDGESRAEEQHQDYHDRAHFFTDQIQHGNFSLRLDNLRAEDKGAYTCTVYSKQRSVLSTQITMKDDDYPFFEDDDYPFFEDDDYPFFEVEVSSAPLVVPPGSSVVLPCYSVEPLPVEDLKDLKVEWRRTDSETLVHLYQDGESRAEEQQQDYHDRAHFFTDQIQHGNFSLRLDNLRAEDKGAYTCTVYSKQRTVLSTVNKVEPGLLDSFLRLHLSLVFCPNMIMFFAFVFWGVSEGSVNETVCCSALYFLRPLLMLWAAPYINKFTGKIKKWILGYSYVAEYVVFSVVVYSALFKTAWQKLLNYAEFERVVIIVMFSIVFLSCLCKIIYLLVSEIGQKSGRIIKIIDLVAEIIFEILPTLQFMILFYTFGSGGAGFIIVVILPVFMMMTNDRWFYRCYRLGCSDSVIRTVMLIFTVVMNAVMIGLYIMTLEKTTDPIGWACVLVFLQILWTLMRFTDEDYYFSFDKGFHRYVLMYVFGSVGVVLLTSVTLITELILKTVNGDRTVGDLRFIVFPVECFFAVSVLISGMFASQIKKCLKSCQDSVRSRRAKRSQQNQNTEETLEMMSSGVQDETQPDSVLSQT